MPAEALAKAGKLSRYARSREAGKIRAVIGAGFAYPQIYSPMAIFDLDRVFGSDILILLCRQTEITHKNKAADLLLFAVVSSRLKAVFLLDG